jgi:hypothetical protein
MVMKVEQCAVCDKVRLCEKHHVIPESCGGVEMWPLCESCHTMVERVPVDKWDRAEALAGIRDVWTRCGSEGRLWLLKMFKVVVHAMKEHT